MRNSALRGPVACVALCMLLALGCGRAGDAPVAAAPAAGEKHYPLTGEVLSADPAKKVLVVRHNAVAGYMPAMTMEFAVSRGDAAVAQAGEKIRADLVVDKAGNVRLESIWPDDKVALDSIDAGARMLHQDTYEKGRSAFRDLGDTVPAFVLFDQSGRVVDSARFRGRQIMMNFIYSRCPVANMCPLSTAKMMETQKLAKQAGISDIEFVSITLDPVHDTPGVLKDYADARNIDTGNFSFLTGPEPAIRDLLTQFGVIAEFKGDILEHTLATLLIDGKGRIVWRADGSQWQPAEFVSRMRK